MMMMMMKGADGNLNATNERIKLSFHDSIGPFRRV